MVLFNFIGKKKQKQESNVVDNRDEKISQQQLDDKLINASKTGDLEQIKELLKLGANVNYKVPEYAKRTPLFFALEQGNEHLEVAEYLIKNGADVSYRKGDGISILEFAEHFNYTNIIKLIKEKM